MAPAKSTKKKKRPTSISSSTLICFRIPKRWKPSVNQAVEDAGMDQSKFVRKAVREKLERMGIKVPSSIPL